jgi:hypothetical protein
MVMQTVKMSEILKGSGKSVKELRERDRSNELYIHEVKRNDRQIIIYTRNLSASRFLSLLEPGDQRFKTFENLADKAIRLNKFKVQEGRNKNVMVTLIPGDDPNKTELTII